LKYDETIDELKDRLDKFQSKLQQKALEIMGSDKTSITYWSGIQRELRDIYDSMRTTFYQWSEFIPKEYYTSISQAIKDLKAIKFKTNLNITDIQGQHASSQIINTLLNDSVSNFVLALNNGEKKLNQVLRLTQQININEKQVNQDISEGYAEGGSTFYAKRKLRDDLAEQIADGKTVKIIDVNGDERNYNVSDYAELVARTKLREAQTNGVLQTARATNNDLVEVSPNPGCDLCNEYAGKVFSLSGDDPDFPILEDDPPYHCRCTHSLTIYVKDFQSDEDLSQDIEFSNSDEVVKEYV
jgi:hypothetical protein